MLRRSQDAMDWQVIAPLYPRGLTSAAQPMNSAARGKHQDRQPVAAGVRAHYPNISVRQVLGTCGSSRSGGVHTERSITATYTLSGRTVTSAMLPSCNAREL